MMPFLDGTGFTEPATGQQIPFDPFDLFAAITAIIRFVKHRDLEAESRVSVLEGCRPCELYANFSYN